MRKLVFLLAAGALVVTACAGSETEDVTEAAAEPEAAAEDDTMAGMEEEEDMEMDDHADHDEMAHDEEGMEDEQGDEGSVIKIVMTEFAYKPARIEVKAGEQVRFRFVNKGAIEHEAVFGTRQEQLHHAEEMASGGGDHHHDMMHVILAPGKSKTLKHTFTETGTILIGCHIPGHWEAGMKARVAITS